MIAGARTEPSRGQGIRRPGAPPGAAACLFAAAAAALLAAAPADAPRWRGTSPELPVFKDGALSQGWTDLGWAPRTLTPGKPAKVDFSSFAGWIFGRGKLESRTGGLVIRLRAPAAFGDFLDVSLGSRTHASFPRVHAVRSSLPDGWSELWIPMDALDPLSTSFDQLVLRASRAVPAESVEIALIGFTAEAPPSARAGVAETVPTRRATAVLDCRRTRLISPLIYGVSFGDAQAAWEMGASARRWGGDTTTRYNWQLGNAWNTGQNWFFRNVEMGKDNPPWDAFLEEDRAHGVATAFTVPIIGWVAKDRTSCGFPIAVFGAQRKVDPYSPQCGDGVAPTGSLLPPGPPAQTSVPASPQFVSDWVRAVRGKDPAPRSATLYYLDNEPTLWHLQHRDVHPERLSYDEMLARTVEYGLALRKADPQARIGGFTAWGWSALFYSAADNMGKGSTVPLDRLAHGGKQFLPWWLSQLRATEKRTGTRVVDLVDVHFYPQAAGIGLYGEGWTDRDSSARRIRSVRALWDPAYQDESWIAEPVRLIPRLREWIDQEYPGLGISIGEYNFGAEGHISGGLAVAEALGRMGQNGVDAAFYWALPPKGSAAFEAFRAFRNYDGNGARVGDVSVGAANSDSGLSSIFATRRTDGSAALVVLNHDPDKVLELAIEPRSCGPARIGRVFSYAGKARLAPVPLGEDARARREVRLLPWSINVIELTPGP